VRAPQDGGPEAEAEDVDDEVVRVNSTLVTVPASVLGRDGKYVTNLRREDFQVYEDGVEQEVAFFANVDAPFTVALLIDTSASTRPVLKDIVAAANAFVEQLRPDDRLIVISFDFEVREILKASRVGDVRGRGFQIPAGGGTTRLYDAVDFAVNERLRHLPGRKAVVLLTDGVDGGSDKGHDESVSDAEESDILIYPVLYDTFEDSLRQLRAMRPGRTPPADYLRKIYERGEKYLSRLAQLTGGRSQRVEGVGGISEAFASVVGELGRQYSLGYYPRSPARPGERRQIKVRVGLPDHAVRARDSYTVTSRGARRAVRDK
jgi:Ca-activated chloride channel family protein